MLLGQLKRWRDALASFFRRDVLLITVLYSLAYGAMLPNTGIFWDDWTLLDVSPSTVIGHFRGNGFPWYGVFHASICALPFATLAYRALIFACFLGACLCLNQVLKSVREYGSSTRLLIVLFFALLPLNHARIAAICAPYALCHLLFYLGFYLVSVNRRVWVRVASLVCFVVAFEMKALLPFYGLVVLFIYYQAWRDGSSRVDGKFLVRTTIRNVDYLLVPILFFIVYSVFFSAAGRYARMYELRPELVLQLPLRLPVILKEALAVPVGDAFRQSFGDLTSCGLTVALWLAFWAVLRTRVDKQSVRLAWLGVCLGLVAIGLGVLSYVAVGKFQYPLEKLDMWRNRNQLLIPLGGSLLLVSGIRIFVRSSARPAVSAAMLSAFVVCNFHHYAAYQVDWYKQVALMEHLAENEEVRNHTTFLFLDLTDDLNAHGRWYRFYDYSGLFKRTFGEQTRFGMNKDMYRRSGIKTRDLERRFDEIFALQDYQPTDPQIQIVVRRGKLNVTSAVTLVRLKLLEMFNKQRFRAEVREILWLQTWKLE